MGLSHPRLLSAHFGLDVYVLRKKQAKTRFTILNLTKTQYLVFSEFEANEATGCVNRRELRRDLKVETLFTRYLRVIQLN